MNNKEQQAREFAEKLCAEITKCIAEFAVSSLNTVNITNVNRTNNNDALAITAVYTDKTNISPTLYVEPMLRAYKDGESIEELASKAINLFQEHHQSQAFDLNQINRENAEEHLYLQVIGKENNKEIAESLAHIEIPGNLIAVPRWRVENFEDGQASIRISREIQTQMLQMTDEELLSIAHRNTANAEYIVKGISEVLRDDMGIPAEMFGEEMFEKKEHMYVATNATKVGGAAVLLSNETLTAAHEKLQGDFYIIPSSLHEVLFIPKEFVDNPRDLQVMCREVNATQVEPADRLGENILYCDGHRLMLCNTLEQLEEIENKLSENISESLSENIGRGMKL